jgi:CubicO group peptidase (beta-lactamase class C family)
VSDTHRTASRQRTDSQRHSRRRTGRGSRNEANSQSPRTPGTADERYQSDSVSSPTSSRNLRSSHNVYLANGWPGFYGTAWYNDPAKDMTAIFIMQRAHAGDQRLTMWPDFWTGCLPGDRRLTSAARDCPVRWRVRGRRPETWTSDLTIRRCSPAASLNRLTTR